jgi:hypothetical protein
MKILNLTQHPASPEQKAAKELLNFNFYPSKEMVEERATELANIVVTSGCDTVSIKGNSLLIPKLEKLLKEAGINSAK